MVGTLVGLKLRLLRNQLRRGSQQVLGLVLVLGIVAFGAGSLALVIALGRADGPLYADLLVLFSAGLTVGWALLPVAASGVDATLDVSRLALLPIRGRVHGPGLLLASMVGVGPLLTVLLLSGFAVQGAGVLGALGVAASVAVQSVQAVLVGRIVVSSLGALLLRRRTRELAFSLGALVTGLMGFGAQVVSRSVEGVERSTVEGWADAARWNPLGLGAAAGGRFLDPGPDGLSAADVFGGVVLLAAGTATCAVAALLWWRLVRRELTSITGDGGAPRRRRRTLPGRGPVTVVAARELRYLWRHPVARTNTITSLVLSGLVLLPQRAALDEPPRVLTAAMLVGTVGLSALNMLAVDGRAVQCDVLCADPAVVLTGKALARAALGTAVVAVVAVVLAALSGGWGYVPLTLLIALGLLGPVLGVGAFASVAMPVPVPDVATGNPWSSAPGQGCVTAIGAMLLFLVAAALSAPVVAAVVAGHLTGSTVSLVLSALAAPAYGWWMWRLGLRAAGRRVAGRIPELLTALAPA